MRDCSHHGQHWVTILVKILFLCLFWWDRRGEDGDRQKTCFFSQATQRPGVLLLCVDKIGNVGITATAYHHWMALGSLDNLIICRASYAVEFLYINLVTFFLLYFHFTAPIPWLFKVQSGWLSKVNSRTNLEYFWLEVDFVKKWLKILLNWFVHIANVCEHLNLTSEHEYSQNKIQCTEKFCLRLQYEWTESWSKK